MSWFDDDLTRFANIWNRIGTGWRWTIMTVIFLNVLTFVSCSLKPEQPMNCTMELGTKVKHKAVDEDKAIAGVIMTRYRGKDCRVVVRHIGKYGSLDTTTFYEHELERWNKNEEQ